MENQDGNIGRLLKERREELGYTLQDAEEETRIRKTYLESLENNRFSELPGQAYVTGFIRVYARYLGLKSNSLLAQLSDLENTETKHVETVKATIRQPVILTAPAPSGDWRKFFMAFVLVIVVGGLVYFLPAFFSDQEQSDQPAKKPVEAEAKKPAPGGPPSEPVKSEAETGKLQEQAADQAQSVQSEDTAPVKAAVPDPDIKQQSRDNKVLSVIPYNGASLRMLALTDSSLIIKVDTRKPHQYKLFAGLDLTWKVKERVRVEFAASDVARFWLNGQEIDIAGSGSFDLNPVDE